MSERVSVTVERIDRAIATTVDCMARHDLPQLLPTLQRLEAERDRLIAIGDPVDHAKRLLARIGVADINKHECKLAA
jgi:FMN phosphatase YigB (HAD superfamily)